jgi:hypothetical protein
VRRVEERAGLQHEDARCDPGRSASASARMPPPIPDPTTMTSKSSAGRCTAGRAAPAPPGLRRTRAAELLVARPVRQPAVLWQIRHKQRQRTKEQERHGLRSFSSSRATIAAPRDPLDRALRQYSRPPRHDRRALPHHGVRRPAVFFRVQNIMIILQDASIYMVLAMGMTPTSARPSFGSSRTASRPCSTSPTPRCWSGTTPSSRRNGARPSP